MRKKNIIEINGHRYEARTGTKLGGAGHHAAPQHVKKVQVHEAPAPKPAVHRSARQATGRSARQAPRPSRTLMRQGLKRPGPSLKRGHKVHGPAGALAPHYLNEMVSGADQRLDEKRLRHARHIPRSKLISHFPPVTAGFESGKPAADKTPPAQPAGPQVTNPPSATIREAAKPQTTNDLLEQAVQRATSHLQPPPAKRRRHERLKRNLGAGAAVGLSVLLLGIIITQNSANVRVQMASAKAGFNVSLPNYRPAGFSLGQLNYSDGVAAAEFNGQNGHYTITQKQTSWDNLELRDKFVAPNYKNYQAITNSNLVIYLYGNRNATWVDGGVWYIIQTDGSLSDSQLVRLATSF